MKDENNKKKTSKKQIKPISLPGSNYKFFTNRPMKYKININPNKESKIKKKVNKHANSNNSSVIYKSVTSRINSDSNNEMESNHEEENDNKEEGEENMDEGENMEEEEGEAQVFNNEEESIHKFVN